MTVPCLRCSAPMIRKPRGRPRRFCTACNRERATERAREHARARAELRREIRADLDHWREAHEYDAGSTDYLYPRIDEYVDNLADPDDRWALVPDRPPAGVGTAAGPDVGRSTGWPDLAEQLDRRAREAAEHPWWAANPHAFYEVNDPERAAVYFDDLAA